MTMTQNDLFTLKNLQYQKVPVKVCNHPFTLIFLHRITYLSSNGSAETGK